ncbi:hypothetical protein CTA2_5596 [Colletotrichum tanaceti]|nr:hypothetical protein CTA2_5596 [Colletotrichum tanaceti]
MTVLKLFYVNLILYVVMLSVAKVSICALYARVFVDPKFRRNVRFVLYFFVAHFLLYGGLVSLQCMPVRAAWDRSVNGRCLNLFAIGYTGAATVILEDLVLIAMPIPELMKLQLSLQKKLALGFMLAVGSFATIASMIRLRYLVEVNRSSDVTWDNFDASLWTSIELGATITCGSLPAVLPLLKRLSGPVERVRAGVGRVWHKVSRVAGLPAGTEKTHTPDVAVGLRHRKRHPTGMTIDSVETQTAVDSVSDGSIDYASTKVAQPVHV